MLWMLLHTASADPDVLRPERTEVPIGREDRVIAAARERLGEPYRWEGRGTSRLPGYDCLGILFRSFGSIDGQRWSSYEVNPSQLVAGGKLGRPVPGLDGVLKEDLDVALLQRGDVLYFLWLGYRIPDDPLMTTTLGEYWPWHTAMYVGEGRVLHARPGGAVQEDALEDVVFDALFVTRGPPG